MGWPRVTGPAKCGNNRLELVLRLGADPHRVALDDRLRLREAFSDALRELPGLVAGQATLQLDLLANGAARGRLQAAPLEDLEAQVAAHGLGLEEVLRGAGPIFIVGGQRDGVLAELEPDLAALE